MLFFTPKSYKNFDSYIRVRQLDIFVCLTGKFNKFA